MNNSLFKSKKFLFDLKIRNSYSFYEILHYTGFLLKQSKFSNDLVYFVFKCRKNFKFSGLIKNRCLFTSNTRAVMSKYKMSRHAFFHKAKQGNVVGFYKSVW
jgi:ribosomal protein S14